MFFLGREISEQRDYSDAIAEKIDEEVKEIIDVEYERARQILTDNRPVLERVVATLLEVETLDADEFVAVVEGRDIPSRSSGEDEKPPRPSVPDSNQATEKNSPKLDMPPSPTPA
jgi:cell division protease FtsH